MFNTKPLIITAAVALVLTGCNSKDSNPVEVVSSASNSTVTSIKTEGYAANYEQIIKDNDGKYLDSKVIEAILGDAAHGHKALNAKLDPKNPYSFEVEDSIDGGNHGNSQCKIPKAFVEVHESAYNNYQKDADFVAKGFGTPIAESALKKWNITVDGDGKGLPDPSVGMTVEKGGQLYVQFCAMCHGEFGEGAKGYLALSGGDDSLVSNDPTDPAPIKTVGSYWPYAVTYFDYIRRTMPFWSPNSPVIGDAGYMGMTGYMLQANDIPLDDKGTMIEDETFFNSELLMKANKYMTNQANWFCDHRPVIHNARCMENCPDTQVGDGKGDTNKYRRARLLPNGELQYNVPQRLKESPPGVGHAGM